MSAKADERFPYLFEGTLLYPYLRILIILVNQITLVSQDRIQQDTRDLDRRTRTDQEHSPRASCPLLLAPNPIPTAFFRNPQSAICNPEQCNALG
jgi:hypothetical protein